MLPTIKQCRLQLEMLFWHCHDALDVSSKYGMDISDAQVRREFIKEECENHSLLDKANLQKMRLMNKDDHSICPLCLEQISAQGFFSKMEQAEGRAVPDLTVTQLNLFHIEELRIGKYGHRPYNLGWGHHHCNVVVKDSGIIETLIWMQSVVQKNKDAGYLTANNNG